MRKGQESEDLVAHYLVGYGWRLVAKNWRSPWAEVDIVLFGKETILLTEVKAIKGTWLADPVSRGQRRRLRLVLEEVIERFPQYKIWMWLALVSDRNEVKIYRDYFGE
ncbi:MAG: YraN family protein [Bdellovibrionales bacterium]|nr:YraN family protein [Bdellovibrionales bacterium]